MYLFSNQMYHLLFAEKAVLIELFQNIFFHIPDFLPI